MSDESNKQKLAERTQEILSHIARYRVTLIPVVWRILFDGVRRNAVVKVLSRMEKSGMVQRMPLMHPQVYFMLTTRTARQFGKGVHWSRPPGPQALPLDVATLFYCTSGARQHERLTEQEIRSVFPWFPGKTNHDVFCRPASADTEILEWIRPDLGGPAHHMVRKCQRRLQSWMTVSDFAKAADAERFRIVFLAPTSGKLDSMKSCISKYEWPPGIHLHLALIPQLLPLSTRYHHGT